MQNYDYEYSDKSNVQITGMMRFKQCATPTWIMNPKKQLFRKKNH